jgi:hypothetical protein
VTRGGSGLQSGARCGHVSRRSATERRCSRGSRVAATRPVAASGTYLEMVARLTPSGRAMEETLQARTAAGPSRVPSTISSRMNSTSAAKRRAAGLADRWTEHAADDLSWRCDELRRSFAGYDLVPLVEQHTGVCFDTRAVELCVLRWAAPHGIRVTGTRSSPISATTPTGSSTSPSTNYCTRPGPRAIRSRAVLTRSPPPRSLRLASPGATQLPATTPGPATPKRTRPKRSISSSTPSSAAQPRRPGVQVDRRR